MTVALFTLALALRVLWVLWVPTKPVGDFAMYVESAAHLVEHGSLDNEYIYMPGYVFLIAPIQNFGGGWLATKLVGACLGGLGTFPIIGLGRLLSRGNRKVGWLAGLCYAVWPAGIAVASVTGTDMPAAVLVGFAGYALVRCGAQRPLLAAALFGILNGLGAYLRAIVVPLSVFSILVFRAQGHSWRRSALYTSLATALALAALSPWALRNHRRYGEFFFTDSHGGLTLLVGANPNSDGAYSRSLNRMFQDVTGYRVLAEPHRAADRTSLQIAKQWIAFDPLFSLSLMVQKAERLWVHERALLYWPLFRQGVLAPPHRQFFARHRATLEAIADSYWLVLLGLSLGGVTLAILRRNWLALSLLPQALVLAGLYIVIFAEQRYRLAITFLLIPLAGFASFSLWDLLKQRPATWKRDLAITLAGVVAVYSLAPLVAHAARGIREAHRWAVHECTLDGKAEFCRWKPTDTGTDAEGQPTLRGVWNGIGLRLTPLPGQTTVQVESVLPVHAQPTATPVRLQATLDLAPWNSNLPDPQGEAILYADGTPLSPPIALAAIAQAMRAGKPYAWTALAATFPRRLSIAVRPIASPLGTRLWLSGLRLNRVGN